MADMQSLTSSAFDSRSLNELKRQASNDPKGQALQVARQVEGMFVQMMLKSMREALPQDGIMGNEQTKLFTSMYDQQIAQEMGKRGLGLAETIVKQMQPATAPDEKAGTVPMKLDNSLFSAPAGQHHCPRSSWSRLCVRQCRVCRRSLHRRVCPVTAASLSPS